jgi:ABC-type polysaccharide/polyol phosphate export permease
MARILNLFFIPDFLTHFNLFRKLVYRDFFAKFVGSALGFFWAILNPLVLMGMYVLLFSVILKIKFDSSGSHVDYGFYLFCGMIPWLSFQESLIKSTNIFIDFRTLIRQIRFPLGFLPLHVAVSTIFQELITFLLFALLVMYYQQTTLDSFWIIFLILPVKFLFTCGFCLFLSTLSVFYRDVIQVIQILLLSWFFASPIVYPVDKIPQLWFHLYQLNPFYHFIQGYRCALLNQHSFSWPGFIYTFALSIGIYSLGYFVFRRNQRQFVQLL